MAAPPSYHISHLFRSNPFSLPLPQMQDPIFGFSFVFFFFVALSLTFLSFSLLHKRWSKTEKKQGQQPGLAPNPEAEKNHDDDPSVVKHSLSRVVDEVHRHDDDSPTHSLLLDGLSADSAKWTSFSDEEGCDDPNSISSGMNGEAEGPGGEQGGKKKKRKAKKKKTNSVAKDGGQKARVGSDSGHRMESACLYPFTSSSSAMQRKIKQQYDELVRCNESKKLTLAQVVQFANSLVDARSELQHKADVIQRKFVITKALLCKADRSSFDRLRQQIYKLEIEQRRLEEDASVYNWLQHQLKLSPAYKKMLEIGACMEKAKSSELGENGDDEFAGISFEELLAKEKKDSFWQKNGKSRLCSS